MIIRKAGDVTPAVLEAMANTPDPRLRAVMDAFVRHMHAFVDEIEPTDEEFDRAIGFLNRIGQTTSAKHNEAILFSDAFGISTLVCLINHARQGRPGTDAALLGPFWRLNQPATENGGSIVRCDTPGEPLFVTGTVVGTGGEPIAGAEIDVWHASPGGMYEVQDPDQVEMNLRGKLHSDAQGRFSFRTVKPAGYPIPTHGPTGDLLRAQRREPMRPAHIHFLIHKPGLRTLITQVFVNDDPRLERDVVFGVTGDLVGDYRPHEGAAPAPDVKGRWHSLEHRFVMEPGESVLPHPPIE